MDPTLAVTVIGVLLTVAFGGFATAFAWLRSDLGSRFDKIDDRLDKLDDRFDKLNDKVDGLIMTLARRGHLTDPDNSSGTDD